MFARLTYGTEIKDRKWSKAEIHSVRYAAQEASLISEILFREGKPPKNFAVSEAMPYVQICTADYYIVVELMKQGELL